jgi:hypothetical protein
VRTLHGSIPRHGARGAATTHSCVLWLGYEGEPEPQCHGRARVWVVVVG